MSEARTLILGAIAGVTILIGLPVGRLHGPRPALRQFLNALAIGILVFLIWDVLTHAYDPLDSALSAYHLHTGGLAKVFGFAALFLGGLGAGFLSLVYFERVLSRRPPPSGSPGPGAMAASVPSGSAVASAVPDAQRLAVLIAVGIGLHNFGEGLAIGASAAKGAISLATLLVIGFALHNATEGFGIVAPLAAEGRRPSWSFLLLMGLVGGGPTLVGTAIGRQFTNDAVSVVFLTLAAGSILYVVIQLLAVARRAGRSEFVYWGIFIGLAAGFATDMVVSAGGA